MLDLKALCSHSTCLLTDRCDYLACPPGVRGGAVQEQRGDSGLQRVPAAARRHRGAAGLQGVRNLFKTGLPLGLPNMGCRKLKSNMKSESESPPSCLCAGFVVVWTCPTVRQVPSPSTLSTGSRRSCFMCPPNCPSPRETRNRWILSKGKHCKPQLSMHKILT